MLVSSATSTAQSRGRTFAAEQNGVVQAVPIPSSTVRLVEWSPPSLSITESLLCWLSHDGQDPVLICTTRWSVAACWAA